MRLRGVQLQCAGVKEAEGPEPVSSTCHASGARCSSVYFSAKIGLSHLSEHVNISVWSGVICNVNTTVLLQGSV